MNNLTSELVFYILASLALICAVLVVIKSNPMASAVCMALCFAAAAGVMFQLDAQFLGVIQILVYTGAIIVLMVFVIMLLNLENEKKILSRPVPLIGGVVIAGVLMMQLWGVIHSLPGADAAAGGEKHNGEIVEFEGFINYGSPIVTTGTTATGETARIVITESRIEPGPALTNAVPKIGHAPAIRIPQIDPTRISAPRDSTLAQNIEDGHFPDTALLGYRLFSTWNRELVIAGFALLAATIGSVVLTGGRPKYK